MAPQCFSEKVQLSFGSKVHPARSMPQFCFAFKFRKKATIRKDLSYAEKCLLTENNGKTIDLRMSVCACGKKTVLIDALEGLGSRKVAHSCLLGKLLITRVTPFELDIILSENLFVIVVKMLFKEEKIMKLINEFIAEKLIRLDFSLSLSLSSSISSSLIVKKVQYVI